MRIFFFAFFAAIVSNSALAQSSCSTIQDPQARLACFDKGTKAPTPKTTPKSGAKEASKGVVARDSGWELKITKDGFSDETTCVISPTDRPWVQINVGHLYVSYRTRGGVNGYTLRIDDNPPGKMQLPDPVDKQIGAVHLGGNKFFDAMSGDRLRIQTLTVLNELKDEDLDLRPMKRLYAKMGPECEKTR